MRVGSQDDIGPLRRFIDEHDASATRIAVVALFAAISVARLLVALPGFGITLLYDLPVALAAVALGRRAGLAAAAAGTVVYVGLDRIAPIQVHGQAVFQNLAGYGSRALVFFLLGAVLGFYADRLRRTEQFLGQVVASAPTAIVSATTDGRVIGFNRAAEVIFGRSMAGVLGRPAVELWPARYHADIGRALADGRPTASTRTAHALRPDGSEVPVEMALTTVEQDGRTVLIGMVSDVTAREALEAERARQRTRLEAANAELEQFASVASHDLQEPLRAVSGFSHLLVRRYQGRLDDQADTYLGFINDGVARMETLIKDLLAYTRTSRSDMRSVAVDTGTVVDLALDAVEARRAESDAIVDVGALPVVRGDAAALQRVFVNLLSNALKFVRDQRPHIEVFADRDDGMWRFSIADNGIGIDDARAEDVFEMLRRLHAHSDYRGTGMGLAICRTIVERHGGRIWCERRAGGGTVFRFTLPAAARPATVEPVPALA